MKVKLYRKVIRAAFIEFITDDRPSTRKILSDYIFAATRKNDYKYDRLPRSMYDAVLASMVWNSRISFEKDFRYNLRPKIEKKYEKYSRKYWTPLSKIQRILNYGTENP